MLVSEDIYELCRPVLQDDDLEEEEKTDKLEEILGNKASLTGRALQDAVLNVLWRYREVTKPGTASPARPPIVRRGSPAPWQISRSSTPLASPSLIGASPSASFSGLARPNLPRNRSALSPFTSPRPSPRLAFAQPLPGSPRLESYEFSSDGLGAPSADGNSKEEDDYGDYGSDTVDWLVNDSLDVPPLSRPSSSAGSAYGSAGVGGSQLSAAAAPWVQPQEAEMSPYDMLRSVLGETKTDDEIEAALQAHDYDLSTTLMDLMASVGADEQGNMLGQDLTNQVTSSPSQVLVGKSMLATPPPTIRQTSYQQAPQGKSSIVCKYWLASGECLRADCRFSHDLNGHVCKYWIMGNCLAGDNCLFSHDPAQLMTTLALSNGVTPTGSNTITPSGSSVNLAVQDYDSFPSLHPGMTNFPTTPNSLPNNIGQQNVRGNNGMYPNLRNNGHPQYPHRAFMGGNPNNRHNNHSRPNSRHSSRPTTPSGNIFSVDDADAFPSLSSSGGGGSGKSGKKHHGKRGGHGHNPKENAANNNLPITPNSMADIVRMSPASAASNNAGLLRKGLTATKTNTKPGETAIIGSTAAPTDRAEAKAIPEPKHIPWLETGERVNQAYMKARQDAFKHGGLRNKFLQSAAQAWNRNDARAAKALSLRGQSENEQMRRAHREAARILYEERNKSLSSASSALQRDEGEDDTQSGSDLELYVDLHGLHPEEAVEYLEKVLLEQVQIQGLGPDAAGGPRKGRPVYTITGTGHHSKGGKDKVGKAVRVWLNEWRYAFREFSVPGDRGNVGGILGIDPRSFRQREGGGGGEEKESVSGDTDTTDGEGFDEITGESPKIMVVKAA